MSDTVPVPRAELSRLSSRVVGVIVGLLIVGGALGWALVRVNDAVAEVHEEVRRAEADRCRITLLSREGSLEKDIRVWTRDKRGAGATQDEIDEFIDGIRDDYNALPVPADCRTEED